MIALLLASVSANAAVLLEGELVGQSLRLVAEKGRVRIHLDQEDHLVDLDQRRVYTIDPKGRAQIRVLEDGGSIGDEVEIRPWGPGPVIAGHASVYHVLSRRRQICGEVLVSGWMKPFLEPVVQAIDLLDRAGAMPRRLLLDPICAPLPFGAFAAAGWPLMIGAIDAPVFRTETISFDYRPARVELSLPAAP